jgi:23S rRNA pseudouridine1911/1915/1917 synthase
MRGADEPRRSFVVPTRAAGERLDVFLAGPIGSRSAAGRLIDAGRVRVDGALRPRRHRLAGGERISLVPTPEPAAAAAASAQAPFVVRYEDDALMVVDKPAGVVVHPSRGHAAGTLVQALDARAGGAADRPRAGIVHRLDRDTSGLLAVAKSDPVHRALRRLLAARAIERRYLALVEGRPPARSGTIDAPIGRDRRVRTRISTDTDRPRTARTHFRLERALPRSTLLRVRLETGRTHQIRVHLQAIGHPIAGDPEYGHPGLYGLRRQFLHASALEFRHPVTGAPVHVESPLPADLAAALERAAAG